MGRVAEAFMEELEEVARLTGEDEYDVKVEWEKARRKGVGVNEFFVDKATYKPKRRKK